MLASHTVRGPPQPPDRNGSLFGLLPHSSMRIQEATADQLRGDEIMNRSVDTSSSKRDRRSTLEGIPLVCTVVTLRGSGDEKGEVNSSLSCLLFDGFIKQSRPHLYVVRAVPLYTL